MFIDARDIETSTNVEADICIVGGGIAGLTIARKLSESGIRSTVIESGGFSPDNATRDLYRGESLNLGYQFADGCRSRFLGGSSNCWGGFCRPFAEHDFERRDWVRNSGWPFGKQELVPYYDEARRFLQLGPDEYGVDYWTRAINRADVRRIPLKTGKVLDAVSHFSNAIKMGDQQRDELASSERINVLLHASASEIRLSDDRARVTQLEVKTLTGRRFSIGARHFILAAGGIENARLMLSSNRQMTDGVGNGNDLVGRYFMDHSRVISGFVQFSKQWPFNRLYDLKFQYRQRKLAVNNVSIAAQLFPSPEVQAQEGLLNSLVWFDSVMPGERSAAAEAFRRMKHRLERKEKPGSTLIEDAWTMAAKPKDWISYAIGFKFNVRSMVRGVRMQAMVESEPDPSSRVTISPANRDALGMPRVLVDWRLSDSVKRTFDRSFELVKTELESNGLARVDLDPPIASAGWPETFEREGTWHHMGTTRMHASPRQGVVDQDCRVHGIANLFVAGSSVFPTVSSNFPTLTLVALALRLSRTLIAEQQSIPSIAS